MTLKHLGLALGTPLLMLAMSLPSLAQDAATPSSLPGGASSLNEQHGDWSVSCAVTQAGKRCVFSQSLVATQSGQRVMSIELAPDASGQSLQGTLLTPFNLRLAAGVSLAIDDQPLLGPVPYFTCVDVGCVVPLAFDATAEAALRAGNLIKVTATAASTNQPVELTLSLKGFTSAATRTAELLK